MQVLTSSAGTRDAFDGDENAARSVIYRHTSRYDEFAKTRLSVTCRDSTAPT